MFRWLVICSLLLLVACSRDAESLLEGTWKQTSQEDSLLGALFSHILPKIELTLKSDHTFMLKLPTLEITVGQTSATSTTERLVEGTWQVQGRAADLKAATTGGKKVDAVRQELADSKAKAAQEEHDRMIQDAIQKQMLAAQGYAVDTPDATNRAPQAPSWLKGSDQLVLPIRAELSDDGRRITLRFEGDSQQPLELERP